MRVPPTDPGWKQALLDGHALTEGQPYDFSGTVRAGGTHICARTDGGWGGFEAPGCLVDEHKVMGYSARFIQQHPHVQSYLPLFIVVDERVSREDLRVRRGVSFSCNDTYHTGNCFAPSTFGCELGDEICMYVTHPARLTRDPHTPNYHRAFPMQVGYHPRCLLRYAWRS